MAKLLSIFWIVAHCALIAAIFWAAVSAFPMANAVYILRHLNGYRHALLTVDTVHFDNGNTDELAMTSCWAIGQIAPNGSVERMSLINFFQKPPESQADVENALHKGDVLPVLYNPDMTDLMTQNETPRVLLDSGDLSSKMRSRIQDWLLCALVPLLAAMLMVFIARRLSKSGPLITLRNPV